MDRKKIKEINKNNIYTLVKSRSKECSSKVNVGLVVCSSSNPNDCLISEKLISYH